MNTPGSLKPLARARSFTEFLGIRLPILLAPMAGACPPSLSVAVANAGGLGACGALLLTPDADNRLDPGVSPGERWGFPAQPLDSGAAAGPRSASRVASKRISCRMGTGSRGDGGERSTTGL